MTVPKAGYLGAVYIGTTKIGGSTTWTYTGETRNMQDRDEFLDEHIKQVPLQIVGGDITITGNYLIAEDAGQKLLKTDFDAKTEITNIRLATDHAESIWLTPKSGSHAIVTNVNNVGDDKSGIGTFSCTLHVNGELEQIGSSSVMSVDTLGDVDASGGTGADGTVTLWGSLLHRGGLTTDIVCGFEYGLTTSYGADAPNPHTFQNADTPNKEEYDDALADLAESTTYYYRAYAEDVDTNRVYGVGMSVDIPAAA